MDRLCVDYLPGLDLSGFDATMNLSTFFTHAPEAPHES
jgi:hypothetical protein